MITTETAKVYRANGRRFFTRHGACQSIARVAINTKCDCEHEHQVDRYVRLLKRRVV